MSAVRLTTNISQSLMTFLTNRSKKLQKTKRDILEDALKVYANEVKKQEMLEGYQLMANDQTEMKEWLEIANNPQNL